MPRIIFYILLVVVALTLVPAGLIYKSMHSRKAAPRIQVVYDMDQQYKAKSQTTNEFFADGVSMRQPPAGAVARGRLYADDAFALGFRNTGGDTVFVDEFPVQVTMDLVKRGRERFDIFCATCHGLSGNGNGPVHVRAASLGEGTWTPPTDLTGATVVERPVGHIYNTIKNGIRNMPAYGPQIDPEDRWAIVAYVRALQLSRNATIDDVPAADRAALTK
jgi:mono/diheme cytochrome c family protein